MAQVFGADGWPDGRCSKASLAPAPLPYERIDLVEDEAAPGEVERRNGGRRIIPTLTFDEGASLPQPGSDATFASLGLARLATWSSYDLAPLRRLGVAPAPLLPRARRIV